MSSNGQTKRNITGSIQAKMTTFISFASMLTTKENLSLIPDVSKKKKMLF